MAILQQPIGTVNCSNEVDLEHMIRIGRGIIVPRAALMKMLEGAAKDKAKSDC